MTMPWREVYSPVGLRLMESTSRYGEGPLFAEMKCDLSVVRRKILEAGTGGEEGRDVSLHTDHSVSVSVSCRNNAAVIAT